MIQGLYAKFAQLNDLKQVLLGTGNRQIVEHTTNDKEWADGGDGSGKNLLGKALMEVREVIRKEEAEKAAATSVQQPIKQKLNNYKIFNYFHPYIIKILLRKAEI